jgi:predicted KAP-like P-loop ATPase
MAKSNDLFNDVKDEINLILESIKPLEKPPPVNVQVLGPTQVFCEWKEVLLKSKLQVEYLLYQGFNIFKHSTSKNFLIY